MANTTNTIRQLKISKTLKYHLSYKENLEGNKCKITNKGYKESINTKDKKSIKKCIPKTNYEHIKLLLC